MPRRAPQGVEALPAVCLRTAPRAHGNRVMVASQAETLRKAIENLIDAKLHDALSRPGGLERLTAHRLTGVASYDIRNAERKLQQSLAEILANEPVNG